MKIAIIGATGLVGRNTIKIIQERKIKADFVLFASKKSVNKKIKIYNKVYKIEELTYDNIKKHKIDFALFCVDEKVSSKFVNGFIKQGAKVIDFSSCYRNTNKLVVPEVNKDIIDKNDKLICNPNCSTIGATVFLNEIHKKFKLEKVIISTYQAVSGAGKNALDDLQKRNKKLKKFIYPIKDNVIGYIGDIYENGYCKEEIKIRNELKKILNDESIKVSATTVRVPVSVCHCETIWFKTKLNCTKKDIIDTLSVSGGVNILNEFPHFPMPIECKGQDNVFVGRIREDLDDENCFFSYIVSDNLRKGASSNAVQILEYLISMGKDDGNI